MYAEDSVEIISEMRDFKAIRILRTFEPDDATCLPHELDDDDRERLLSKMPKGDAEMKCRHFARFADIRPGYDQWCHDPVRYLRVR
jgi:Mg/Co/Ni transporter MgtE